MADSCKTEECRVDKMTPPESWSSHLQMMMSLMSLESSFHCKKPGPNGSSIFFLGNGIPGMESGKGRGSHSERTAWGWHTIVHRHHGKRKTWLPQGKAEDRSWRSCGPCSGSLLHLGRNCALLLVNRVVLHLLRWIFRKCYKRIFLAMSLLSLPLSHDEIL